MKAVSLWSLYAYYITFTDGAFPLAHRIQAIPQRDTCYDTVPARFDFPLEKGRLRDKMGQNDLEQCSGTFFK